jgi:hypothetical protein
VACDFLVVWSMTGTASSPGNWDQAVAAMGVRVLRTPPPAPTANAACERLSRKAPLECVDFLIPLDQRHLKHILNGGWTIAITAALT